MEQEVVATLISFALIITGIIGLIFPALPGAILIWLGIVAYGILNPNVNWSLNFYLVQGLLAISTYVFDYVATIWGVKKFKGSKAGAIGAVIGMLFVFIIGPGGLIIGPFLGALIGELIAGGELKQALTSGFGSFVGFILALLIRLIICGIMLFLFISRVISAIPIGDKFF